MSTMLKTKENTKYQKRKTCQNKFIHTDSEVKRMTLQNEEYIDDFGMYSLVALNIRAPSPTGEHQSFPRGCKPLGEKEGISLIMFVIFLARTGSNNKYNDYVTNS